ncbi:hypothetical protein [Glaciimonas immobilis]|uniref:Uncharacterized protein n=1 Tax=Glaciimonas immobilis TaxID=728004 RepID=A0A840RSJ0_9BURK|nr:hypothetical protein [Glaciimonas immobilis]KAF3997662.1 hypothetical protein HAV38_13455 [Glaciimonas immobilis]MBB5200623.1 hypothetical protein [Glaciimonas immobilis]
MPNKRIGSFLLIFIFIDLIAWNFFQEEIYIIGGWGTTFLNIDDHASNKVLVFSVVLAIPIKIFKLLSHFKTESTLLGTAIILGDLEIRLPLLVKEFTLTVIVGGAILALLSISGEAEPQLSLVRFMIITMLTYGVVCAFLGFIKFIPLLREERFD